jgi:galactokinase/mevalonate kinase-like predicted kinase
VGEQEKDGIVNHKPQNEKIYQTAIDAGVYGGKVSGAGGGGFHVLMTDPGTKAWSS